MNNITPLELSKIICCVPYQVNQFESQRINLHKKQCWSPTDYCTDQELTDKINFYANIIKKLEARNNE